MNVSEIRELTIKEIIEKIETEKAFLVKQRLNHAVSPLDNPLKLKVARKNIARLLTILREKELKEQNK
jgi:large subunit ribosomal protein L29